MKTKKKISKQNPAICLCNQVSKEEIEQAITRGCNTLPKLFDATSAGVGACGGSCRPFLQKILDHFKNTGKFLENPRTLIERNNSRIDLSDI